MAVKDIVGDVTNDPCTGCTKGLPFVINIITSGNTAEFDKIRLCSPCKKALNKAIKEVL